MSHSALSQTEPKLFRLVLTDWADGPWSHDEGSVVPGTISIESLLPSPVPYIPRLTVVPRRLLAAQFLQNIAHPVTGTYRQKKPYLAHFKKNIQTRNRWLFGTMIHDELGGC